MALYPVVILAGGLATRLRPLTNTTPKALIPLHGKPFIAYQLERLCDEGVEEVILCVGFLGELIEDYVGDGSCFGLKVRTFHDGQTLLGTAGAICSILPHLAPHFFVMYGDSYLTCPFASVQKTYEQKQKKGLMTVFHNRGLFDQSNVDYFQGNILRYSKKAATSQMEYIDYGLGMFSRKGFEDLLTNHPLTNHPLDLADVYRDLLSQKELAGCEVHERFYEVGSFSGIEALEKHLESKR